MTASRVLVPMEGPPIHLSLGEAKLVEQREGAAPVETLFASRPFAFVGFANRARQLLAEGFIEHEVVAQATLPTLSDSSEVLAYMSCCDVTRSQVQQEAAVGVALARVPRDALWKELVATLSCVEWPHVFDVEPLLRGARRTEAPWLAVVALALEQEPTRYPRELIRIASTLGSAKVVRLCMQALSRVQDEDAWMDVLIEGEPVMERSDSAQLRVLAKEAPSKQVAKLVRQIVADLRAS